MINNLLNKYLFDLKAFEYKDLIEDKYPWQSVAELSNFIQKLFDERKIVPNYKNRPNVYVGEGTIIHSTVEIIGPAIIGKNCEIRHTAYLRENCILGDNVIIGHAAEVKNSIVLNKSIVNHFTYVGDSILGNKVNISAGAKLANLRLDKKNTSIKTDAGRIDTGLKKFGAAIGDGSMIGVNSVLNPGTFIGKNSVVFPLKSVTGVHKNDSVIK